MIELASLGKKRETGSGSTTTASFVINFDERVVCVGA
jgi:hypothetical protein